MQIKYKKQAPRTVILPYGAGKIQLNEMISQSAPIFFMEHL